MQRRTDAEIRAQVEWIVEILREHPEGLTRPEIGTALEGRYGVKLPRRTLIRRLQQLDSEGPVDIEGEGRATRYFPAGEVDVPPEPGDSATPPPDGDTPEEDVEGPVVPLSSEALALQRLVRLPRQQREPCTYRREFLESYVPNETWYLPEPVRDELAALGETSDPGQAAGTYARAILGRLLIDLSWASSRLEGNTYSRLDTQNLIEHGQRAEGKTEREHQMILNHRQAIRMLVENVEQIGFDRPTVLGLHAALSENLVDNATDEGALRQRPVGINDTVYRPTNIPQVIEECFDLMLMKLRAIQDPFEQAFFVMAHVPYLQPFVDVNKRTSRIAANIPFIKENRCPLSFIDIPHELYVEAVIGIYERRDVALLRDLFVWSYRRSCALYRVEREAMGEPDTVRFRYRNELADLIRETVAAAAPIRRSDFRAWARDHAVDDEDLEAFVERAMDILLNLTEGMIGRYDLSPDDVATWRAALAAGQEAGAAG